MIVSDGFERLTGYSREMVVGKTSLELGIWPSVQERNRLVDQIRRMGCTRNWQMKLRRSTGELIDSCISIVPIVIGGLDCLIGLNTDLSGRDHADEELRRSEERMRQALDVEGFGVWDLDFVRQQVHLDERLLQLHGMRSDEVPKSPLAWEALTHPDDLQRVRDCMKECFEGRTPVCHVEYRVKHSSGEYRWVRVKGAVTARDMDGHPLRAVGTTLDISDKKQVEQELQEKQAQLQGIAANIPGVVYQLVVGADGAMDVTFVAGRALEFFGLPPDVADVFSWFVSRLDPEDQVRLVATSRESIEKVSPWRFEGRLNLPSGGKVWVQGMSLPQVVGKKLVYNGVFLDITERKQAEQVAHRNQERYERILNTSQDGIWISNAQFQAVYVNERLSLMLGYPIDELLKMTIRQMHFNEDWPVIEQRLAERRLGEHSVYEARFRRVDGSGMWGLISATAMMDHNGGFEGSFAMIKDITALKRTEESLRESEESYRALFESAQDAIFLLQHGQTVRFNRRAMELFDASEEVLRKIPPHELSPLKQSDGTLSQMRATEVITRAIAGVPQLFEWLHERPDGTQFHAEVSLSRIVRQGEPMLQAVVRDISDRKRAEARQSALQAQLIQAQKMEAIGQLAGGVAHDFNNIITAILMHLNLLKTSKQIPPNLISGLSELETEAKRAANLTRQLLMFSRRQVLQPQVLDINSLLGNLLKMLRRLIGEHISLAFDGTPEDLWVEADPGMIEQVVVNLVVNARDAMPQGGSVTITTRQLNLMSVTASHNSAARPGQFVCLEVSDTGTGIAPDVIKHIFEPFFTTKEESKGTGLGLATVYGIVTQHDGWVDVESELDKGSRFRVFLPFIKQGPSAANASISETVPGGRETILLVEDEKSVRRNAALTLRNLGYEVVEARTGNEALLLWRTHQSRISLLLTDMVMPGGMTGMDLIDKVLEESPSMRVILMSGYSTEMARDGIFSRKNLVFLQKPFGAQTLARAVRDLLDSSGGSYVQTYGNAPE